MNKVILSGGIGKDAELTKVGENAVIKFPFATSRKWKNKQGEQQEKTEWHNIVIWRKDGLLPFLKKGVRLLLDGEINYSEYEKDGVKKYFTSINIHNVEFLSSAKENKDEQNKTAMQKVQNAAVKNQQTETIPEGEDDLPF